MVLFILLGLALYANGRLARKKGLNPYVWGGITLLAVFVAYCLLGSIYVSIIYTGPITRDALQAWMLASPLTLTMLGLLGAGGFLLVRYILERKKSVE